MSEHRTGTREEWQTARDELAKLEAAQAERNKEIESKRRELPWVRVEKEYTFDTESGNEQQAAQKPDVQQMLANPPPFLKEWSRQVGTDIKVGLRENPSWISFALENGTVYHTYTVSAPDPFVAPYFNFLLARTPKGLPEDPSSWRKDEYPE